MSDNPAKPPRFPYVAALLCAACAGAAAWTWMRYSYCWTLTPEWIATALPDVVADDTRFPSRAYIEVTGKPLVYTEFFGGTDASIWATSFQVGDGASVLMYGTGTPPGYGRMTVSGRLGATDHGPDTADVLYIYRSQRRFHPASIAGLVVGAMGVFVSTVALRHCLRERRAAMALEGP